MSFQSEIARIPLGFYMVLMCHTDADIASLLTLHWLKWVPLRNFLFLLFFFCIFPCPSYLLFSPFFLIFHYNCCRQGHRHKLVHVVIGMKGTITSGSSALLSPPREGDHARCRLHPWELLFGVGAKVRAEIQTQNTMHGTNNGYRSWRLSLVAITELALAAGPRARPPPPPNSSPYRLYWARIQSPQMGSAMVMGPQAVTRVATILEPLHVYEPCMGRGED